MIFFTVEQKTRQYVKLASIGLFSLYIIVDTYLNFNKEYDGDLVISTLDYYTDIMAIFKNILSYFSNDEMI
jgi:FtsH-binding integral membrane protein